MATGGKELAPSGLCVRTSGTKILDQRKYKFCLVRVPSCGSDDDAPRALVVLLFLFCEEASERASLRNLIILRMPPPPKRERERAVPQRRAKT